MAQLFLPPRVARELAQRTLSYRADVMASIDLEGSRHLLELAMAVQRVNRHLLLVRARDQVVLGVPMKPGYYHLLEDKGSESSAPISITVIEGPNGEFVEPTSRVLEKIAAGNAKERRNWERWEEIKRGEKAANDREQANNNEERRDHLRELVNAYTRTSVSMHGDWTQNSQPNGNRARGERRKKRRK